MKRGICQVCERERNVRADGRVMVHRSLAKDRADSIDCRGSGYKPKKTEPGAAEQAMSAFVAWTQRDYANGTDIAYRIRAELVCCDAFDRGVQAGHAICYWGEAAARIAEDMSSIQPANPQQGSGDYAKAVHVVEGRGYDQAVANILNDERYLAWLKTKGVPQKAQEWAQLDALPTSHRLAQYLKETKDEK